MSGTGASPARARDATPADLASAASWVTSRRECELWAGPGVAFPVEASMLEEHTGFDGALNVALVDGRGLVAFGQAILKDARRAHLARVIVRPDARSRGWGRTLVEELLARARKSGVSRVTLNVCRDNAAAASLYRSLGFSRVARPEGDERPPHGAAGRPHDDAAPCDAWLMARDLDSHTADERRAYEEGTCGHES